MASAGAVETCCDLRRAHHTAPSSLRENDSMMFLNENPYKNWQQEKWLIRSHRLTCFQFHSMQSWTCTGLPLFLSSQTAVSRRQNDAISQRNTYHKSMHIPHTAKLIHSLVHIETLNGVRRGSHSKTAALNQMYWRGACTICGVQYFNNHKWNSLCVCTCQQEALVKSNEKILGDIDCEQFASWELWSPEL